MKHVHIHIILAVFVITSCNAQNITRIQLKKIQAEHIEDGFDYKMGTLIDTAYIKFKKSGDFGRIYHVSFVLKDSLPNGKYEIYVDNKLKQKLIF